MVRSKPAAILLFWDFVIPTNCIIQTNRSDMVIKDFKERI